MICDRTTPQPESLFNKGMQLWGANVAEGTEHALIETNMMRVGSALPIDFSDSGVKTFDNASPENLLIPAVDNQTGLKAPELVTAIRAALEEDFVMSFLKWEYSIFAFVMLLGVFAASCANVFSPFNSNSSSSAPFFTPSEFGPSVRYQQVYSQADFSTAGDLPLWITEIGFISGASLDLPHVEIRFSSTTRNEGNLSSVFDENFGSGMTVVHSGALHVENDPFTHGTYGFRIPLQTPFLYDRLGGNLLMEVKNFDTADIPVELRQFARMSAADTPGDGTASLTSFDVSSSTARFSITVGLSTLFVVEAIPEPSTVFLLLTGLAVACSVAVRKRLRMK